MAELKAIPGLDGYYATRDGLIYSTRGTGKLVRLIQQETTDGYFQVATSHAGRASKHRVHRLIAKTFIGIPDNHASLHVRHLDGDSKNNRVENLAWGTMRENSQDSKRLGRLATGHRNGAYVHPEKVLRGDSHGSSKLTENQVRLIRALLSTKSRKEIADQFGVTKHAIRYIAVRRTWKHI